MREKSTAPDGSSGATRAAGSEYLSAGSDPKITNLKRRRQARKRRQVSYQQTLWGPARLVVGYLAIVLVVENSTRDRWRILDSFNVMSETFYDSFTDQMQQVGFGRYWVKANLSPAVFSPRGAGDSEAKAAMARLERRGFSTSSEIIGIRDPEILWWIDGGPRPGHL
jgi:hypothetical protein